MRTDVIVTLPDGTVCRVEDADHLDRLCKMPDALVICDAVLVDDVPTGATVLLDAHHEGGLIDRDGITRRYAVELAPPDERLTEETHHALLELVTELLLAAGPDQLGTLMPKVRRTLPRPVASHVVEMWLAGLDDEAMIAARAMG